MSGLASVLFLAAALQLGSPSSAPLTRELSDSFGRKLQTLERYEHDARVRRVPVSVSESELNSYLRFALAAKVPRGLRDVRIVLREGLLEIRGFANLSEFREIQEKTGASFLALLGGDLPVEVVAGFRSDRGFGQFVLQSAQIGPMPLSPSLVADLVARATVDATRPSGFDMRAPFRLPYAVKRIRPLRASATIEY